VEAIIGLIGVVVGGLLSAVASYLASRSLEGRKIAAHRRAAARLVNQELKRAAVTLGRIRGVAAFQPQERSEQEASAQPEAALAVLPTEKRADWRTLKFDLDDRLPKVTSEVWETHQPTLAEVLRDSEWQAVERAYEEVDSTKSIDAELREHREEPDLAGWEYRLKDAVDAIAEARAALDAAASRQSA
jgi:hypothetical protein